MITRVYKLALSYKNPLHWVPNIMWRFPETISDLRVYFIVGAPRSGTTLLQKMVSSHSMLFSIQTETGVFSFQNLFVADKNHFELTEKERGELFVQARDIVDYFDKGVRTLMRKNNGKEFVEKTPQHVNYLPLILNHFPNSKVIHLVRDGRDCYCSAKNYPNLIPQAESCITFARYWKKCVSNPLRFRNSTNLITVRYEDLVNNPRNQLGKIMSFIGFPLEEQQLDPAVFGNDRRAEQAPFHRLSSAVSPASVLRWQTELTAMEKDQFEQIASHELSEFGYETSLFFTKKQL